MKYEEKGNTYTNTRDKTKIDRRKKKEEAMTSTGLSRTNAADRGLITGWKRR